MDNSDSSDLRLSTRVESTARTFVHHPAGIVPDSELWAAEEETPELMDIEWRWDMRPGAAVEEEFGRNQSPPPLAAIEYVVPYIDHNTWLSLRMCNRYMRYVADFISPPKYPAVIRLPLEIVHNIYARLGAIDFNSARHTCSRWRQFSLDRAMLETMLARGGWSSGANAEMAARLRIGSPQLSVEQFLSARLARECALRHNWLSTSIAPALATPKDGRTANALTVRYTTDFTELASADYSPKTDLPCGLGFTFSTCSRFLLVAEGCVVYVYLLSGPRLRPISSILCPRRVLAMSMDASGNRYSVAALLDGRMGLVSNLNAESMYDEAPSPQVYSDYSLGTLAPRGSSSIASHSINGEMATTAPHNNDDHVAEAAQVDSIHIRSPHQSVILRNAAHGTEQNAVIQDWPREYDAPYAQLLPADDLGIIRTIPRSAAPLSVYHSLCSPDDPPRSVAICPSRSCLAFGCAAGIELHWIDTNSGRNLMKWFPLTAPSDFLYFLPSRPNIDNPHKLRLISSKAGPGQRGGIDRFGRRTAARRRLGLNWSSLRLDATGLRDADYDHYAAFPLSDGTHILFTEPATGHIFLGSDAPAGGPTKLLRKVWLEPPPSIQCTSAQPPILYTAGVDLTWGVRIVAAYGEDIVLFTVPPDMLNDIKRISGAANAPAHDDGDEYQLGAWADWIEPRPVNPERTSSSAATQAASSSVRSIPIQWPIVVRGARLGRIAHLVDLAVQSGPSLVVWALSSIGTATTWTLSGGAAGHAIHRVISSEGGLDPDREDDGDWIMQDEWRRAAAREIRASACIGTSDDHYGNVDVNHDDELAYEIAYNEHTANNGAYRPTPYADRDGDVDMVNSSDDFARWSGDQSGEGSSPNRFQGFDGACDLADGLAHTTSARTSIRSFDLSSDLNMIDVCDELPFEVELFNSEVSASFRTLLAATRTSSVVTGAPSAVIGTLGAVIGSPSAVIGSPSAVTGGTPTAVSAIPSAIKAQVAPTSPTDSGPSSSSAVKARRDSAVAM